MKITTPILTRAEVAELLRVSERTIWRYVRDGGLPYIKIDGGRMRFETRSVLEWCKKNIQEMRR